MFGLNACHREDDLAALLFPRLDPHDPLHCPSAARVYVATAVVINTGHSENIAKLPCGGKKETERA